jgi:hypothetical protein
MRLPGREASNRFFHRDQVSWSLIRLMRVEARARESAFSCSASAARPERTAWEEPPAPIP